MADTFSKRSVDDAEFCSVCKNILSPLKPNGTKSCYVCKEIVIVQSEMESEYVIHFNSPQNINMGNQKKKTVEADGPVAERKCPKCPNNLMSYAAIQLRSADEGQTVFYTCTKCKYTESENS